MSSTNETSASQTKSVEGCYGFAMLDGDVFLVQVLSYSAPRTYHVHVFRHNFVSLFSYSHTQSLGSNLLEILESTNASETSQFFLEEDTDTVFVAPEVMSRYIWLKDKLVPQMGLRKSATARLTQRPSFLGHGFNRGSRSRMASRLAVDA